jgi:hypothetical protein
METKVGEAKVDSNWNKPIDYLTARRQAGTQEGDALVARLEAMAPERAAALLEDAYRLCSLEDLEGELVNELLLSHSATERIAVALRQLRARSNYGQ